MPSAVEPSNRPSPWGPWDPVTMRSTPLSAAMTGISRLALRALTATSRSAWGTPAWSARVSRWWSDHLALTPAGLLVVETKTYSGIILGQPNESTWTQAIGRQRHRFQNPLRQNFAHVRVIEALVPDIPVEGRVVFASHAQFPKGLPV